MDEKERQQDRFSPKRLRNSATKVYYALGRDFAGDIPLLMDWAADTIEALRGEATSKGIRVSSPGEQDFSKYCLEITDDKGRVVKYALNADGTQGAAMSDKAQEDEIYWYAVVRERDRKVRALFDFEPAAKKWCDDWNAQSAQNPYYFVRLTDEQVRMLFTKPWLYGFARLATD